MIINNNEEEFIKSDNYTEDFVVGQKMKVKPKLISINHIKYFDQTKVVDSEKKRKDFQSDKQKTESEPIN